MDINQYNKSMDEISVKKYDIEDLENIRSKTLRKEHIKKYVLPVILIGILFINILPSNHPKITITAYAAENEVQLTKKFTEFDLSAMPSDGGNYDDTNGYINFNIYFKCEGQDIKSITYTCSDRTVNRNNRRSALAYYVENMTVPQNEYNTYIKDTSFLYGGYGIGEDTARIVRLIGNAYTVTYEDQSDVQYGLILAATIEKINNFHYYYIKDTIIKVDILFNDGTIQHEKILFKSDGNAFNSVQIRIL